MHPLIGEVRAEVSVLTVLQLGQRFLSPLDADPESIGLVAAQASLYSTNPTGSTTVERLVVVIDVDVSLTNLRIEVLLHPNHLVRSDLDFTIDRVLVRAER